MANGELTGFMTNIISVKKAEVYYINGIVRLYNVNNSVLQQQIESRWKKIIAKSENDFHNDVYFVIRDRRKKIIGMMRAVKQEKNGVAISIWLPNSENEERYLRRIYESVVEYYEDWESFDFISRILLVKEIDKITFYPSKYVKLSDKIQVKNTL